MSARVDAATGIIHTVVGSGYTGYSGDGGPATSAQLMAPTGMAIDGTGNYYIADFFNHRVRRVAADTGFISTMVGVGTQGLSGDDGPAGAAQLIGPYGTAVDSAGNVYIADTFNNRVRKIEAFSGIIRTVAGTGAIEYSGDNGPARSAGLSMPEAVISDRSGNLFVCDTANHRIRRIDAATGVITTVAGNGDRGYSGDNGPATSARLNVPSRACCLIPRAICSSRTPIITGFAGWILPEASLPRLQATAAAASPATMLPRYPRACESRPALRWILWGTCTSPTPATSGFGRLRRRPAL